MIIDATDRFLKRAEQIQKQIWEKRVEEVMTAFAEGTMSLDDFLNEISDLGFDNAMTRSLPNED